MHLFFWVTVTAAVVGFFARIVHADGLWRATIAPLIAAVALGAILAVTLREFDTLLGVAPDSPLRWAFPAAYGVAGLLGIVWALILRATRPHIYDAIGLGADSLSVPLRHPDVARQPA